MSILFTRRLCYFRSGFIINFTCAFLASTARIRYAAVLLGLNQEIQNKKENAERIA